jgi:N,N-dimethylformamidase beta subunit-like, C-terminal
MTAALAASPKLGLQLKTEQREAPMNTSKLTIAAALAVCTSVVAVVGVNARRALIVSEAAPVKAPVVHSERSGLWIGTGALSGRVSLVASTAGLRWRLIGVTGWHRSTGRVLLGNWDTTKLTDGPYFIELDGGHGITTQSMFVRNYTYLGPWLNANASGGLDKRSTDAQSVVGVFTRRSYKPHETATLKLSDRYPHVTVEILHVGPEKQLTIGNETMEGVPVAGPFTVAGNHGTIRLRVGDWESGLYAARMTSASKVGFAPFVVRPARLGEQPVAVVMPTNTWQAYNWRDADGDGKADTWYYWWGKRPWVDVQRPYLNRGVPPHFRQYDTNFLRWLAHSGRHADFLAQEDIERLSGERLKQLYRLIVFPGHHEYVTQGEYDAVQRYRDLGGHLAFLSANAFFWRVNRDGNILRRIALWRQIGRPEAALVGVQYFGWNQNKYESRPYTLVGAHHAPWLFAGTGLRNGNQFAQGGIEADRVTAASPKTLQVIATIPNMFNSGHAAAMTYYETRSGARVFAAGAFTLAGVQSRTSAVGQVLSNLWDNLAGETSSGV